MGAIRNFVLDMGNVLFDYNPGAMTEYFLPAAPEEDKERFLKEFFSGSEWIDRDLAIPPRKRCTTACRKGFRHGFTNLCGTAFRAGRCA